MNKISENKVKELITELKEMSSLEDGKRKKGYWYTQKKRIVDSNNISTELIKQFLDEYLRIKKRKNIEEIIETDDRAVTSVERDDDGNIEYYCFEIFRKDSPTLAGKLDRKEMETIYRLYSIYGSNLTQKIVSREFPQYTFIEFKRILKAFNIYKASSEFPQHLIEEKTEEELIQLHNQNKENNVLRRLEKDQLTEANKLINKLAKENQELKKQQFDLTNIKVNLGNFKPLEVKTTYQDSNIDLVLHLADLHIGSKCESYPLYENKWDETEIERRLNCILQEIDKLGHLNVLIINLLGDNLDGMDGQTARRDHIMPQNMDNMKQIETFLAVMTKFIANCTLRANEIRIYSVKDGNHDGIAGYLATLALKQTIKNLYPDIEFDLAKEYFNCYQFGEHYYCLCHGKDDKFMKKGMPLNMNDKTQVMIYEYLESQGLLGEPNVHVIKGDLHSNALNSCRLFDYRNVLSLYGASDYSNYNFSRNSYGVSYDLFIGDTRTIGTFENF